MTTFNANTEAANHFIALYKEELTIDNCSETLAEWFETYENAHECDVIDVERIVFEQLF